MGRNFLFTMIMTLLVLSLAPQGQAIPSTDQVQTVTLSPKFYALIGTGIPGGEETDNIITFVKTSGSDVTITLNGDFYVDNEAYRDKVYFTFFGPTGEILESSEHSEYALMKQFFVDAADPNGEYKILIDLGTPPPQGSLDCCAAYNYRLSYSGLDSPPRIEAMGDDFGYIPDYGYTTIRNDGTSFTMSFYGYESTYRMYHQPWGIHDVISKLELVHPNGTIEELSETMISQKARYEFKLTETGYAKLRVYVNSDGNSLHRVMGFKLVQGRELSEGAHQLVPVIFHDVADFDADKDMIMDSEELLLGLNPYKADSDNDGSPDKLELIFSSDGADFNVGAINLWLKPSSDLETGTFDFALESQNIVSEIDIHYDLELSVPVIEEDLIKMSGDISQFTSTEFSVNVESTAASWEFIDYQLRIQVFDRNSVPNSHYLLQRDSTLNTILLDQGDTSRTSDTDNATSSDDDISSTQISGSVITDDIGTTNTSEGNTSITLGLSDIDGFTVGVAASSVSMLLIPYQIKRRRH